MWHNRFMKKSISTLLLVVSILCLCSMCAFATDDDGIVFFNATSCRIFVEFQDVPSVANLDEAVSLFHYGTEVEVSAEFDSNFPNLLTVIASQAFNRDEVYTLVLKGEDFGLSQDFKKSFVIRYLTASDIEGKPNFSGSLTAKEADGTETRWFKSAGGANSKYNADGSGAWFRLMTPAIPNVGDLINYNIEYDSFYGGGEDIVTMRNSNSVGFNTAAAAPVGFQPAFGAIANNTYPQDEDGNEIPNEYYRFRFFKLAKPMFDKMSRIRTTDSLIDSKTSSYNLDKPTTGEKYSVCVQVLDNTMMLGVDDVQYLKVNDDRLNFGAFSVNTYSSDANSNYIDKIAVTKCETFVAGNTTPAFGEENVPINTDIVVNLEEKLNVFDFMEKSREYIKITKNSQSIDDFTTSVAEDGKTVTIKLNGGCEYGATYIFKFSKNILFEKETDYTVPDFYFVTEPNIFDLDIGAEVSGKPVDSLLNIISNEFDIKYLCRNNKIENGVAGKLVIAIYGDGNMMLDSREIDVSLSKGEKVENKESFSHGLEVKKVVSMLISSSDKSIISYNEIKTADDESLTASETGVRITDIVNSKISVQKKGCKGNIIPLIITLIPDDTDKPEKILHYELIKPDMNGNFRTDITLDTTSLSAGDIQAVLVNEHTFEKVYFAPFEVMVQEAKKVCGKNETDEYTVDELIKNLNGGKKILAYEKTVFSNVNTATLAQLLISEAGKISFDDESEALQNLNEAVLKYSVLAAFKDGKKDVLFDEKNEYKMTEIYDLFSDVKNETSLYNVYTDGLNSAGKAAFATGVADANADSFSKLSSAVAKNIILQGIKNNIGSGYGFISNILTTQNAKFSGMDIPKYLSLSDKEYANSLIINEGSTLTLENLCNVIESCAKNPPVNSQPPGGSTGGGSGSGIISSGIPPKVITPENNAGNKTEGAVIFSDLEGAEWVYDAVNFLSQRDIINGVGENCFNPNGNVTREETVKMLVLAYNLENTDGEDIAFSDVESGAWYESYLNIAVKNMLINGISDGVFGAGLPITRQDFAVIIYRASKMELNTTEQFSDAALVSDYAKDAVNALKSNGILSGYEDGSFRPDAFITRAEAAQILYNVLKTGE